MDLRFLISTSFLLLAAVGAAAADHASLLPAEIYWHKVLPNVPMPSAILDLLHPGCIGIGTSADSSKNGHEQYGMKLAINKDYGQYSTNRASKFYGRFSTSLANNKDYNQYSTNRATKFYGRFGTNLANNKGYDQYSTDRATKFYGRFGTNLANNKGYDQYSTDRATKFYGRFGTNLANNKDYDQYSTDRGTKFYGRFGTNMANNKDYDQYSTDRGTKFYGRFGTNLANNKYYGQFAGNLANNNFYGQYAGNIANKKYYGGYGGKKIDHHFHNDSNMSLFFLEKDLQPGSTKSMLFVRNIIMSTFLPRREADSIPFSSTKLPEILDRFSVKKDSAEAAAIETTIDECEMPQFEREHKFCATSLESLVESSMSALGTRDVQAVSTSVSKEGTPKQAYTVAASGVQRLPGSETVACHPSLYPYAVYYCHSITGTKAYGIALTGKDGTKVDAVAVCHTETAGWNPEHVAFRVLGEKPGAVICHILPQDSMLWTPRN